MKKLLLFLIVIVAQYVTAYAEGQYTVTFYSDAKTATSISTSTKISTFVSDGANYLSSVKSVSNCYYADSKVMRLGSGSGDKAKAGSIEFNLSDDGKVAATSISIKCAKYNNTKDLEADITVNGQKFHLSKTDFDTYTVNLDGTVINTLSLSAPVKTRVFVESITVNYGGGSGETKSNAELSFDKQSVDFTFGDTDFISPAVNNPHGLDVKYSSKDETIAKVDASTGVLTLIGIGSTTITATSAETDKYYAGKAEYTLTVKEKTIDPDEPVTGDLVDYFDVNSFTFEKETNYYSFTVTSKVTGVEYAFNVAKSNSNVLQFRSKENSSGFVSTKNPKGLIVESVKIEVQSGANSYWIYGDNSAYTSIGNLYQVSGNTIKGTRIAETSSSTTATFDGNYTFVGFRSKSGALYIKSITITYAKTPAIDQTTVESSASAKEVTVGEETVNSYNIDILFNSNNGFADTYELMMGDVVVATVDKATAETEGLAMLSAENVHPTAEYSIVAKNGTKVLETLPVVIENKPALSVKASEKPVVLKTGGVDENGLITVHAWIFYESESNLVWHSASVTSTTHAETVSAVKEDNYSHKIVVSNYDQLEFDGENVTTSGVTFDEIKLSIVPVFKFAVAAQSAGAPKRAAGDVNVIEVTGAPFSHSVTVDGDKTVTGIESVVADADAEVEYYNLQGVRVINPENGLYIRRQGNTATKVYIK